MSDSFELMATFDVPAMTVYRAWLDGASHSAMTGAPAESDPVAGGRFSAWDGYISGIHRELVPGKKIVQAWRTTEFPADAPDSVVEILLEEEGHGTKLILRHSSIPDGQGEEYRQGWVDYYFSPMKEYFSE
ncbi:MAG TPA: hypothetical protein DIC34_21585 [Treponema sp.]|nr:MAG: hypothetical protein A2001_17550 [Treponema sp. GWC1_61_84]HCM29094.1 hypothetical protein [Treponema sp.]